jgi:hypothetical protein
MAWSTSCQVMTASGGAGGRRGDPRLGQPVHAQQIRQPGGVALVVFHPPIGPALHPQRMRQMNRRAAGLQHIGRPIPAVGGLQHHLRVRPGLGHLARQRDRVVVDADLLEHLAVFILPDDHRPSTVQVDAYILRRHRGLPPG